MALTTRQSEDYRYPLREHRKELASGISCAGPQACKQLRFNNQPIVRAIPGGVPSRVAR